MGTRGLPTKEAQPMPFDSPAPPDPDNRPWLDVLHLRPANPDSCYHTESRWNRDREQRKLDNKKKTKRTPRVRKTA
jgi:hypothetical protein